MTISLRKNRKQKKFNMNSTLFFPYLRIDFFNVLHKNEEVTSNNFIIDKEKLIGEYVKRNDVEKMSVDTKMTVSHFEQSFNPLGLGCNYFVIQGKSGWKQVLLIRGRLKTKTKKENSLQINIINY
jgi:hypothetical protein